jgi:flagellar basal body rod protein FlgB
MYRVTEEYDLVANPIYNISMPRTPQQGTITTSTTVATTTSGNTVDTDYEEIEVSDVHGNKPRFSTTMTASQLATDV